MKQFHIIDKVIPQMSVEHPIPRKQQTVSLTIMLYKRPKLFHMIKSPLIDSDKMFFPFANCSFT